MSNITLKDIYDINQRLEEKLDKMSDRVSDLEIWRAELKGKIAIVVVFLSFGVSMAWDTIKEKFFKS